MYLSSFLLQAISDAMDDKVSVILSKNDLFQTDPLCNPLWQEILSRRVSIPN